MNEMTETQRRVLACVREWIVENGEGPTVREIGRSVGLSSPSSVAYQLGKLQQLGAISRDDRRWRSIRLC
ncbi:LexA family protein [Streptomyces sp. NPDC058572]|uniref:LexA family protein n=1 Tax=Streptomyces sp. NPDC058572 TaxID=3346546 RepID=UPI003661956D